MNEETIEQAYVQLFKSQNTDYNFQVKFSAKFGSYNANVKKSGDNIVFSFSREWETVSDEISMGLVQELLRKILRKKVTPTTNMQLYDIFVKNLHLAVPKTATDEKLLEIFNKVNDTYFNNILEAPNLQWSGESKTKLASYDYHTDSIKVSTIFKEADEDILAYLLYHEMLHKKLKFTGMGKKTVHHGREFRELEKQFENQEEMERKLQRYARSGRRRSWLGGNVRFLVFLTSATKCF